MGSEQGGSRWGRGIALVRTRLSDLVRQEMKLQEVRR